MFKVGDEYYHSFKVSEDVYKGFLSVFKDTNPLHTNKAFANQKGFKEKVMHGNILNGFLSYFIGELLPTKDVIIHSQSIAFKNPVFMNEVLTFEGKVSDFIESVNVVIFKYKFINDNNKTAAKGTIQIGVFK